MKLTPLLACIAATSTASFLPNTTTPPRLHPLFTATINLSPPFSQSPIPLIPGGSRQRKLPRSPTQQIFPMVPITSGLITGAINATITAGLAYPALYNNGTVEVPAIILYGTTTDDDDKLPYLIQLAGVGKLTEQVTRVQIEIGGRYKALSDAFIIAEIKPDAARTGVVVYGYEVLLKE